MKFRFWKDNKHYTEIIADDVFKAKEQIKGLKYIKVSIAGEMKIIPRYSRLLNLLIKCRGELSIPELIILQNEISKQLVTKIE